MKAVVYVRATNIYDDSRATKEITALADAGYSVIVLAWNRSGEAEKKCNKVFEKYNEVVRFHFFNQGLPNGIGMKNMTKLVRWFKWVYKMLNQISDINIVHACNLDSGISAYKFCKKKKIPLVYDIYDYYVDSHKIPNFAISMVEKIEIKIINFANLAIICTEERFEQIEKATPQKVIVIHNSPDVAEVPECKIECDYVYCGAFCRRRLLDEILTSYQYNSDLVFKFAGYGEFTDKARNIVIEYDNISFLGQLTYSEVIKVESRAMALAAIYEPTVRNHRLCAPNKFYEALALGKPVVVCRGTGIDKIVDNNDVGVVIDYDVDQFYSAIRMLKNDRDKCQGMGKRARELYEQKYKWTIMRERLIESYAKILEQ